MAYYKKEPTAFTLGNKGQGPKSKEEKEQNRGNKNWNKKPAENAPKEEPCCTGCGKAQCTCTKINDWENKL